MRILTESDIRFQIRWALQQISHGAYREITGAADRREKGLERATDTIMARFDGYEFQGPDPIPAHGDIRTARPD